jgi:hypothetical protein
LTEYIIIRPRPTSRHTAVPAAIWWFGWFGPVTEMFLQIKRNTVQR